MYNVRKAMEKRGFRKLSETGGMAKQHALDRMKSTGKGGSQKKLDKFNRKVDAKDEFEK